MPSLIHACKTWSVWRAIHRNLVPQTLEDIDIVVNICARQADGQPTTVNQLVANCIFSRNTVLRRLQALVSLGIVSVKSSLADKRFKELSLTRKGIGIVRKAANGLKQLSAAMRAGT